MPDIITAPDTVGAFTITKATTLADLTKYSRDSFVTLAKLGKKLADDTIMVKANVGRGAILLAQRTLEAAKASNPKVTIPADNEWTATKVLRALGYGDATGGKLDDDKIARDFGVPYNSMMEIIDHGRGFVCLPEVTTVRQYVAEARKLVAEQQQTDPTVAWNSKTARSAVNKVVTGNTSNRQTGSTKAKDALVHAITSGKATPKDKSDMGTQTAERFDAYAKLKGFPSFAKLGEYTDDELALALWAINKVREANKATAPESDLAKVS